MSHLKFLHQVLVATNNHDSVLFKDVIQSTTIIHRDFFDLLLGRLIRFCRRFILLGRLWNLCHQLINFAVGGFEFAGKSIFALLALVELLFSGVCNFHRSRLTLFSSIQLFLQLFNLLDQCILIGVLCAAKKFVGDRPLQLIVVCFAETANCDVHRQHRVVEIDDGSHCKT